MSASIGILLKRLRRHASEASARLQYVHFLLFSILIGFAAAIGAYIFRWLIFFFQDILWAQGAGFPDRISASPVWAVLLIPTAGGIIAGVIIHLWGPEARGPGVPEVIKAIAVRGGRIRHRVTFVKAAVTSLLIGCGASVGREGPIIQIGASLASSLARLLKITPEMLPVCVASGAAAGISATFNAPLTGTLFAIEIILLDTEMSYISHIIVASVTASALSKIFWGDFPTFQISKFPFSNFNELIIFFLLGVVAGLLAICFMVMIRSSENIFSRINLPIWLKPGLGGLLLGCLALKIPGAMGVGYDVVNTGLNGSMLLDMALILLLAKLFATSLCIGSGMSGGIFAPSLVLGATLGVSISSSLNMLFPGLALTQGQYALVGMGTMVAGTTLAPITAVLTVFELTYSYKVILPMMVGCITSAMIVRLFYGYSIYEGKLLRMGVNIIRGHEDNILVNVSVVEGMETEFDLLHETDSLEHAADMAVNSTFPHFPVVDKNDRLTGIITLRDLRGYLKNQQEIPGNEIVDTLMSRTLVTVNRNTSLKEALSIFEKTGVSFMPVLDSDGKVSGILKPFEAFRMYRDKRRKNHILSTSR
ncbi:chloride channel protein [Maridesulfovibrio bastinii]|uniref:chloride channel protein n=1 Tax=Maridesulfovibrio bastinii TaxID=47157 RepID=UPI00041B0ED9|nr:chloride channel protein [Maridesulfovibrio bastinii]